MNKKIVFASIALVVLAGAFLWNTSLSETETAPDTSVVYLNDGDTYTLVAAPLMKRIAGKTYLMLAYNGTIPGPTIRVHKGAEVTINVKNELGEDTTLHSHGIRMDNAFDGVPGVTQEPIKNGETFAYHLKFPDAGSFWYHPHVATAKTVESGLYGALIVDDGPVPANAEVSLAVDDILVDARGPVPFPATGVNYTLMGRYGNVLLVNGTTDWRMSAQAGAVVRFHITDVANARPFRLSIPGAKMKLVGSDGGRYMHEAFVENVTISPGERIMVDVFFEKPGAYTLTHTTPEKTYALGVIAVSDVQTAQSYADVFGTVQTADIGISADRIRALVRQVPDKKLRMTMSMGMAGMAGMHMMPDGTMMGEQMAGMSHGAMSGTLSADGIEWEDDMAAMNAQSTDRMVKWQLVDEATGKANMDIMWSFERGTITKVRVVNDANAMHPMQHPLHFHGQRFLVLATDGVPNTNPVWKDTVLIPAGVTVDLAVDMSNPGSWMAHCHILEHADSGMMFAFMVK